MPLIELRSFMPVCDKCGERDSVYRDVKRGDTSRAIPDGWRALPLDSSGEKWLLVCYECIERGGETGGEPDVQQMPQDKAD